MTSKYLEMFLANYNGESVGAKSLEDSLQQIGGSGAKYIGWATMEVLATAQDPDMVPAQVVTSPQNTLVWTSTTLIETYQEVVKDGVANVTSTRGDAMAHMVVLEATWFGKTLREYYPIQRVMKGSGYTPIKAYDSNDLNKAIQRGKAKLLSRLTGIGLKLYEEGDLQFEDDADTTTAVKEDKKKPTPKKAKAEKKDAEDVDLTLADYIVQNFDQLEKGINKMAGALKSQYDSELTKEMDAVQVQAVLDKITNPTVFVNSLKKASGIK